MFRDNKLKRKSVKRKKLSLKNRDLIEKSRPKKTKKGVVINNVANPRKVKNQEFQNKKLIAK